MPFSERSASRYKQKQIQANFLAISRAAPHDPGQKPRRIDDREDEFARAPYIACKGAAHG